jgi:hypothetical protein
VTGAPSPSFPLKEDTMARFEDLSVGRLTITGDKKVGVPSNGTTGYDSGSLIQYRGSGTNLGAVPCWINVGDKTSALFVPYGPQKGYGIYRAGGTIASAGGDTTETITVSDGLDNWDIGFAGHGASDDTDNIVAAKLTDKTITITGSADPLTAHGYNYGVIRQGRQKLLLLLVFLQQTLPLSVTGRPTIQIRLRKLSVRRTP